MRNMGVIVLLILASVVLLAPGTAADECWKCAPANVGQKCVACGTGTGMSECLTGADFEGNPTCTPSGGGCGPPHLVPCGGGSEIPCDETPPGPVCGEEIFGIVFGADLETADAIFGPVATYRVVRNAERDLTPSAAASLLDGIARGRSNLRLINWHVGNGANQSRGLVAEDGRGYAFKVTRTPGRLHMRVWGVDALRPGRTLASVALGPEEVLLVRTTMGGRESLVAMNVRLARGESTAVEQMIADAAAFAPRERVSLRWMTREETAIGSD